jgi:hypothetical protein
MNVTRRNSSMVVQLDADEADLVRGLLREVRDLMERDDHEDPVVGRLMPAAYEDAVEQAKYRDVLGDSLRQAKLEAIDVVEQGVGTTGKSEATVSDEQVPAWLGVITDIRLAIATRIGVTQEMMDEQLDPTDPNAAALSIVHWLAWLQESMIEINDPI